MLKYFQAFDLFHTIDMLTLLCTSPAYRTLLIGLSFMLTVLVYNCLCLSIYCLASPTYLSVAAGVFFRGDPFRIDRGRKAPIASTRRK